MCNDYSIQLLDYSALYIDFMTGLSYDETGQIGSL
ncbi:hypothetical protein BACCAP_01438 [Pseudoflavonifractor capillosus ATCC 29799]|uniref:Uncharacterized protein n=1 Tax=Pseudoflavonifractor capillosus ATCC 29799 TaxID=411467 RepID=A6NTA9_9FIRM|nr:hypothetical protein BACCAP_01438 [Pseudoflavonifractor capillosus ATCC 29799]